VGDGGVEYSRTREGFAFTVLTASPWEDAPPLTEPGSRPCPEAPSDPWVVLAEIVIDPTGAIAKVDCVTHRRTVHHP
jgi:hypothetical protein